MDDVSCSLRYQNITMLSYFIGLFKKMDISIKDFKFNFFILSTWTYTSTQLLIFKVSCLSIPMRLLFCTTMEEDPGKIIHFLKNKKSIYFHLISLPKYLDSWKNTSLGLFLLYRKIAKEIEILNLYLTDHTL